MKRILLVLLTLLLFDINILPGQKTVGLLSYNPALSYDGYNLIYPHNQPSVYLLDNCGEIVHTWDDDAFFRPGNTAYLLEDGRMVKTKRPATVVNDPIWAGGGGATVEIRDWENNLDWSFTLNDSIARLHHDIEVMPNGNILMIVWEVKSREEAIMAGRDSTTLDEDELWPDYIIEVDPTTDDIVWEWHAWDHLIQDFDSTKANFGVVSEHPELININFDNNGAADWMHSNAIDYHPDIDQILLCVPFFNEIWIIDHSTTTEQAASNFGGRANRGGNLIYRWGNPQAYDRGTEEDQQLFNNHDAHWVLDFVEFSHPDYGKIAVFNNQAGPDFSTANVISTPWDMYSWEYPLPEGDWEPMNFDRTITHPDPTAIYSTGLSSVQLLPNGNTLICAGRLGYSVELTPENSIVWEYRTPLRNGQPVSQGDTLQINNNLTFRMDRFPIDYGAFTDRDLTSKGWIEENPDSTFCQLILPVSDIMKRYFLKVYPNPASQYLTIEWNGGLYANIEILDLHGRRVEAFRATGGRKFIDTTDWPAGLYLVRIGGVEVEKLLITR